MSECKFCEGKIVHSHSIATRNGFRTMHEMVNSLFGREDPDEDENFGPLAVCDGIRLVNGNKMRFDTSSQEYLPHELEINYCPFCGKELKGEENNAG